MSEAPLSPENDTQANWRNSTFARRDELTGFVKWVKTNPEIDDSIKRLVAGLATSYNRERSR